MSDLNLIQPDRLIDVREVFGVDTDLRVPAFSERDDHVPEIDDAYRFNPDVTLALLAGFARNRRVLVQGLHGTGKSTHVEQVAARLNWPCVRVNLDGHISRLDLVGKDAGFQRSGGTSVTQYRPPVMLAQKASASGAIGMMAAMPTTATGLTSVMVWCPSGGAQAVEACCDREALRKR